MPARAAAQLGFAFPEPRHSWQPVEPASVAPLSEAAVFGLNVLAHVVGRPYVDAMYRRVLGAEWETGLDHRRSLEGLHNAREGVHLDLEMFDGETARCRVWCVYNMRDMELVPSDALGWTAPTTGGWSHCGLLRPASMLWERLDGGTCHWDVGKGTWTRGTPPATPKAKPAPKPVPVAPPVPSLPDTPPSPEAFGLAALGKLVYPDDCFALMHRRVTSAAWVREPHAAGDGLAAEVTLDLEMFDGLAATAVLSVTAPWRPADGDLVHGTDWRYATVEGRWARLDGGSCAAKGVSGTPAWVWSRVSDDPHTVR